MKAALSWLNEFVSLSQSPEEIKEALTLGGLEVEGVKTTDAETFFEIALTPNLGHCMSHLGIARELAALLGAPLKESAVKLKEEGAPIESLIDVVVEARDACPLYTCRIIEGVKVGPSPKWLQERLEGCGVHSVNNIVDATNYILLGYGQPLHAFDLDAIDGKRLRVTANTSFDTIETLDHLNRALAPGTLLLADAKKPLAIAGVMGALNSAVTEGTRRIVLESAYFSPQEVRKASKYLGLRTDSSIRFEKGIDPNNICASLDRAAALIVSLAGGKIARGRIERSACSFEPKKFPLRPKRINELLGTALSLNEVFHLLKRLRFEVAQESDEVLKVRVPTYRNDITQEIDLIEEVARIFGYNNIPTRPERHISTPIPDDPMHLFTERLRSLLLQEGLQEWMTCNLISPKLSEICHEKKGELIAVLKAASVDQSVLRPSLLPSMLLSVKLNLDHQTEDVSAFEVGRVHFKVEETFLEKTCAAVCLMGKSAPYHFDPKPRPYDVLDLKGIVENLLEALHVEGIHFSPSHHPNFHPKQQAHILCGKQILGTLGQVHPLLLRHLKIERALFFFEINVDMLRTLAPQHLLFKGLSLYPSSTRDWTVTVLSSLSIQSLLDAVRAAHSPYLESVTLLDLYKSDQIGKDRKNVTFRFVYRDPNKTIAQETVEKEHARIIEGVARYTI